MTKKDKAYLAEGLHRLCADLAAIATLFEQPEEATPKPTSAEDPPAALAPEENVEQAPMPTPDPPVKRAPTPSATPTAKPVTYEEVRAVLADKSRTGYRAEVKALLTAHGVRQLSEITDSAVYAELIREAEEIGNG